MEQKANITIDNHHITVERLQTACGREIRVISVFPRHGSETVEDKLKALAERTSGVPKKPALGDRIVANVIYRDGTVIDTIKQVAD